MIRGTRSEDIINVLNRIALSKRLEVVEVSLDMASNMRKACEMAFPNATLVIDLPCSTLGYGCHATRTHRPALERDRQGE